MNIMQKQVQDFHDACGITIGNCPEIRDKDLRVSLITEESNELVDALNKNDIVGAIDGMCDLIYVVMGTAVAMGIDLEPFYNEVHFTNMLKTIGPKRADGKQLKPANWEPPRIKLILDTQMSITFSGAGYDTPSLFNRDGYGK